MIASQEGHVGRPPRLEQHEQREGLQAVVAAVHKVPHEDVVRLGDLPARREELQEIMKLPMDVSAHLSKAEPTSPPSVGQAVSMCALVVAGEKGPASARELPRLSCYWHVLRAARATTMPAQMHHSFNAESSRSPADTSADPRRSYGEAMVQHRHRAIDWLHIRLLHKDLLNLRDRHALSKAEDNSRSMPPFPSIASTNVHSVNMTITLY